ncbi:MAG: hypothetical protein ACREON_19750 [Gemmatimonadaceae bacterium]
MRHAFRACTSISMAMGVLALSLPLAIAAPQSALVSTDELAPFDEDFIRYPALTSDEREYFLQRWKDMLDQARTERAAAVEAQSRGLDTQATIDRYDQDIKDVLRQIVRLSSQRVTDALAVAKAGKASDIEALRKDIAVVVEAARIGQLLGDPSADEQQRKLVEVVKTFSQKFAETCEQQSFNPLIAMGLKRQNELLGTGVDVDHCAFRLFEASIRTGQQNTRWRHCGLGVGRWLMKAEGLDVGKGEAELDDNGQGAFTSHYTKVGTVSADVTHTGTLRMKRTEIANAEGHITAVKYAIIQSITSISGKMFVGPIAAPVSGVLSSAPMTIAVINDNKACDPDKDVWTYR